MKRKLLMLCLCLLGAWRLLGQDSLMQTQKYKQLSVYITPSTILDFTPRYRIGFAKRLSERWEGAVALGLGSQGLNGFRVNEMSWNENYRFYEIRPEARYVLAQNKGLVFMLAMEGFYTQMNCDRFNGSYHRGDARIDYDEAFYTKIKAGINVKAHLRISLSSRVYTECYLGLGYAGRDIWYSDVKNPRRSDFLPFEDWTFTDILIPDKTQLPQIPFGFTWGYVFLKD